jgi:hypothetical protein
MPEWSRQDQVTHVLRHRHDVQRLTPSFLSRATLIALAALTVLWFFLGSAGVSAAATRGNLASAQLVLLGAIVTVNFAALILATLAAYRPPARWGYAFIVVVLALNVLGSVLDQVGLWDVVYLLMSVTALVLAALAWRAQRRMSVVD